MSAYTEKDLNNILRSIKELAAEETLSEENKESVLRSVEKIQSLFQGIFEENYDLRRTDEFQDGSGDSSPQNDSIQEFNHVISCYKSYLKIKYLLKKFKELYDLFKEYDSPTQLLLKKKRDLLRQMAKAVRPFHDVARALCQEGVIEDISSVLIDLTTKQNFFTEDPIETIAQYVRRRKQEREKINENTTDSTKTGKVPLKKHDCTFSMNCYSAKMPEQPLPSAVSDVGTRKMSGASVVPPDVLSALYMNYPAEVADDFVRAVSSGGGKRPSGSCPQLIGGLEPASDTDRLTGSAVEWAVGELCPPQGGRTPQRLREEPAEASDIRPIATRFLSANFPKLSNRKKYFTKAEEQNDNTELTIKKYHMEGEVQRVLSNTALFYANEKRINLESTMKEQILLENIARDSKCDSEYKPFDETSDTKWKEKDEEIKKYLDQINSVRMESLERYGYPKLKNKSPFHGSLEKSISIRIPAGNKAIITQRMSNREKMVLDAQRASKLRKILHQTTKSSSYD